MKFFLLNIMLPVGFFFTSCGVSFSQSTPAIWIQQAGINGFDADQPKIVYNGQDHVYLLGHFYKTFKLGSEVLEPQGKGNIFASKLDTAGNLLWIKRFWYNDEGSSDHLYQNNIRYAQTDSQGNLYFAGSFADSLITYDNAFPVVGYDHDIYLMKLDPEGDIAWFHNTVGGSVTYDPPRGLSVDQEDNVVFSYESNDVYTLLKLNPDGDSIWSKSFFVSYPHSFHSMTTDQSNNIYICGRFDEMYVLESDTLISFEGADQNVFYAKFDPDGNLLWSRVVGSYCDNGFSSPAIHTDHDNNVFLSCRMPDCALYFEGDSVLKVDEDAILLAKLNPDGSILWYHQAFSSDDFYDRVFDFDEGNNVYFSVSYYYNPFVGIADTVLPGEGRFLLSKISADGELLWVKNPGGAITWNLRMQSMATDDQDNLYLTGHFFGLALFGDTSYFAPPWHESIYLAKIDESSWVPVTVSIPEEKELVVSAGPNPVSDVLRVVMNTSNTCHYRIYDITGFCVKGGMLKTNITDVNLTGFSPGLYFMEVVGKGYKQTIKLVKG